MKLPDWLWPPVTGKTFLDVWSICHFAAGVVIGYDLGSQNRSFARLVLLTVLLGYLWEVVETLIEKYFPGVVKHPEGPLNRWVSDPLMVLLGAFLGFWLVGYQ
jgi:hypothetical protein